MNIIAGDIDPKPYTEAGGAKVLARPKVAGVTGQLTQTTEKAGKVTRLYFVKGKYTVLMSATGDVTMAQLVTLANALGGLS